MKAKLLKLLTVALLLSLTIFATACVSSEDPTSGHEHSREFLKYVEEYHWYECSCGITYGLEEHFKELKYNENGHWYECVCGDIDAKVNHEYELKYNKNSHWYECSCGITYGLEEHNFKDNICVICGEDNFSKGLEYELNFGGMSYSVVGIGSCTDTDIIIPGFYEDLPVTSIDFGAFYRCDSLTSVEIGESVTSIGERAFSMCSSLTSVVIGDSVTSIGDSAFSYCSSLTSVVIGDSVTSIGFGAFYDCSSLTSVYYKGTASEWAEIISTTSGNGYLTRATIYYV